MDYKPSHFKIEARDDSSVERPRRYSASASSTLVELPQQIENTTINSLYEPIGRSGLEHVPRRAAVVSVSARWRVALSSTFHQRFDPLPGSCELRRPVALRGGGSPRSDRRMLAEGRCRRGAL